MPGGLGGSHNNFSASLNLYSLNLYSCTDSCTVANQRGELGVGGKPGGQVRRAREVEQGVGQSFELLQRQRLDLGGGGA